MNYNDCYPYMSKQDCDIYILERAISNAKKEQNKHLIKNEKIQHLIQLIQQFLIEKKLILYGGVAINNILPKENQFYSINEFPDYDVFSQTPIEHIKEMSNILYQHGFRDIEAKTALHYGTYKLFVDFIPVLDLTYIPQNLYKRLYKNSIEIGGFHYAPPNFLRMSMYLELSSPAGDISRWNKIYNRLQLLNKYYPILEHSPKQCTYKSSLQDKELFKLLHQCVEQHHIVVLGTYAYSLFMKQHYNQPRIDGFHTHPKECLKSIKSILPKTNSYRLIFHKSVGEILPEHYELRMNNKYTLMILFKPTECNSYNEYNKIRVASFDTLLRMYLAFIVYPKPYYDETLLLCMCQLLLQHKKTNQHLWKRFSHPCYGYQKTMRDLRKEKKQKYKSLKRGTDEWNKWFFKYNPSLKSKTKKKKLKHSNP